MTAGTYLWFAASEKHLIDHFHACAETYRARTGTLPAECRTNPATAPALAGISDIAIVADDKIAPNNLWFGPRPEGVR